MSAGIWVIHTEVANLGVTLFGGYSYDGLNVRGITLNMARKFYVIVHILPLPEA